MSPTEREGYILFLVWIPLVSALESASFSNILIIMSPTEGEGYILFLVWIPLVSALESASFSNILIIISPHQRGGVHTVFGVDPVGVGFRVSVI